MLDQIGFWQQAEHLDACDDPIVIDSHDIRENPVGVLRAISSALDLLFSPVMLSWNKGFLRTLPELSGEYADLTNQAMQNYRKQSSQKHT